MKDFKQLGRYIARLRDVAKSEPASLAAALECVCNAAESTIPESTDKLVLYRSHKDDAWRSLGIALSAADAEVEAQRKRGAAYPLTKIIDLGEQ